MISLDCHRFDGSPVVVQLKDLGLRTYQPRGKPPYRAVTTKITVDGRTRYSRVEADLLAIARDPLRLRAREDNAVIEQFGVDTTAMTP